MRAVNLIPVEQRSGQPVGAGRSQGGAYAVLVVVAGLALMAYLYGEASHQISSRGTQAAALTNEAHQTQAAAEKLAPYTSFIAMREQRTQAVDALVDSRFDWAHVLHEFGRVMPADTSISSLSGTVGSTAGAGSTAAASSTITPSNGSSTAAAASSSVASSTPSGSVPTFSLTGCAINQPSVALMLERLHLIDGVTEVTLQSSETGSSGSGSGSGSCPANDASFSATVTFDPLPSTSAVAAATKTVSDSTTAAASSTKASTK
jgi:Tfp pilus assembly protein PilN